MNKNILKKIEKYILPDTDKRFDNSSKEVVHLQHLSNLSQERIRMYIGKKVRTLRKGLNLSLVELSQKSGVQLATLSRMEHHKMVGTLQSHLKIAKAMGVEVTELYSDIVPEGKMVTVGRKPVEPDMYMDSHKSSYELLTNQVMDKKLMPILLKIEPGGKTTREQQRAGSEKFIFVIDGKVEVGISGKTYQLSKGNTLYFKASLPHHFTNIGKLTARVLSVLTPVTL